MSLTLFHSPLSPFVRKVVVMLHETGQFERVTLQTVQLTPVNPSDTLNPHNPAGKIPALRLADGSVLHDSRVILDYLDHQHAGEPLIPREGPERWRVLTLASLADAVMDASVLLRYETFLRPEDKRWDGWQTAQWAKIGRALAHVEATDLEALARRFDVAAIGVACALGYLDLRHPEHDWRARAPGLAQWYAAISQRPSMRASAPPPP